MYCRTVAGSVGLLVTSVRVIYTWQVTLMYAEL
jgi:hypothetical protein